MIRRLSTTAYWAVPWVVCLILYWPGLMAWFQQDDFVWLNLRNQIHDGQSFWHTVFWPTVQGTWRPLSERIFFLLFGSLFGSDALPYRIWVFLTMFANLALLESVCARIARSRAAGFWAAIFWIANSKLATVMSWTCEYILVACGFFLLLALHFFLRYIDTGERRYYLSTWAAFLTGFLAMETNIVFPALAAVYTLGCARKYFSRTLPFFIASAVYGVLHVALAPNQGTIPYTMHFDGALPATFVKYWRLAFEPFELQHLAPVPRLVGTLFMAFCTAALLGFIVYQARRRRWLPAVLLAWYAILLGPVLPLRDHISSYYLTLPAMALAMLGACALIAAWRSGALWRMAGALLAAAFLFQQAPVARGYAQWFDDRSQAQEQLVMGVQRAHELHPGKAILLDGVDDTLFWGSIQQRPFLFLKIPDVYLTPGSEAIITPYPDIDDVSKFILPAAEARQALEHDRAVVYRTGAGPLRNITALWKPPADAAATHSSPILDVADPLAAGRLGPTWYGIDNGIRWMPASATVRLPGPRTSGQKLYVTATCPAAQLQKGPLEMRLGIDGVRMPPVHFTKPDQDSTFVFTLPPQTVGKPEIEITIDLSRTVRVGADQRDLGLAFGRFEIK